MRPVLVLLAVVALLAGCGGSGTTAARTRTGSPAPFPATPLPIHTVSGGLPAVPHFAHIVVVVEENHAQSQIIGDPSAPYFNTLARDGVQLTNAFGITHPSQPNYLALFSGSTHGVTDDSCPQHFTADNLAAQLNHTGQSFVGYAEGLPAPGSSVCSAGSYARKHVPWTDFAGLPASVDQPMSAFPSDYSRLPKVAFVIPDLDNDMHDGTVAAADAWLRTQLGGYVDWARSNDSLLIVTWDEDDNTPSNHIPGILVGAHVRPGDYGGRVDHYTLLRTIEVACDLPPLGEAANRAPLTGSWTDVTPSAPTPSR